MKKKDLITIIVVVFISAIFSYVLSTTFITPAKNRQAKVEVVGKINSDFPELSDKYFNENSIDPTLLIQIGNNQNPQPFQQPGQ